MRSVQRVDLQCKGGDSRTCVWQGEGIQIMRVRLTPGEALPPHNATADVILVPPGAARVGGGGGAGGAV